MTIKFHRSDDGTVIDGKTVVFLRAPAAAAVPEAAAVALIDKPGQARRREQDAISQAAALVAAAENGIPFCEKCEKARRGLAGK